MSTTDGQEIVLAWCRDPGIADAAAALFAAEADVAYISHGELQGGRAVAPGVWAPDLRDRVRSSLADAAARDPEQGGTHLATAMRGRELIGFALANFVGAAPRPYAVLEDVILADTARGQGIGTAMLDWLASECRSRGMHRMFLESGQSNHLAHAFFERHGFGTVSIVKMREL